MPKINVYLPDELADAVKDAGVPVSAICQRALEQAVRRVTAIRETALSDLQGDDPGAGMAHLTGRTRAVFTLAVNQARAVGAAEVGTEHLLGAMLDEGQNLALGVLRSMEIDPDAVGRDLSRRMSAAEVDGGPARRFSGPAANALEAAVAEAHSFGHNYVGCEHLLLGLVAEPEGVAGQVLRGLGADLRLTRRAVAAALAGYVHLQANTAAAAAAAPAVDVAAIIRQELRPLTERIDRLEERLGG